jgi:hypothetical protein
MIVSAYANLLAGAARRECVQGCDWPPIPARAASKRPNQAVTA